jgi:hypothetical protein
METSLLPEPRRASTIALPVILAKVEKPKVALVPPLATITDDGIVSAVLVDIRLTVVGNPGPLRVTVQFPPEPAGILVGLHVSDKRLGFRSRDIVEV